MRSCFFHCDFKQNVLHSGCDIHRCTIVPNNQSFINETFVPFRTLLENLLHSGEKPLERIMSEMRYKIPKLVYYSMCSSLEKSLILSKGQSSGFVRSEEGRPLNDLDSGRALLVYSTTGRDDGANEEIACYKTLLTKHLRTEYEELENPKAAEMTSAITHFVRSHPNARFLLMVFAFHGDKKDNIQCKDRYCTINEILSAVEKGEMNHCEVQPTVGFCSGMAHGSLCFLQ